MDSNNKETEMQSDELQYKILQRDKIKKSLMSDKKSSNEEIEFLLKRL